MKRILFLLLVLSCYSAIAQTVLKKGTLGYVTINGQNYHRGYLGSQYNYATTDSTLCILYLQPYASRFIQPGLRTTYLDGDHSNAAFPSMDSLRKWMNENFEFSGQVGDSSTFATLTALKDSIDAVRAALIDTAGDIRASSGGSGGGCISSCTLPDDATIDGHGKFIDVANTSYVAFNSAGFSGIFVGLSHGDEQALIGIGGNPVFDANATNKQTIIRFGNTGILMDDIAGTIELFASPVYTKGNIVLWDGTDATTVIKQGSVSTQSTDAASYISIITAADGSNNLIEFGNALSFIDVSLSATGTTLNFAPPIYADDAAAITGGLVAGDWYQITSTKALTVVQP